MVKTLSLFGKQICIDEAKTELHNQGKLCIATVKLKSGNVTNCVDISNTTTYLAQ